MKNSLVSLKRFVFFLTALFLVNIVIAQSNSKIRKLKADSKVAKAEFIKGDALMKSLFSNAYGYVIFPNIGKGGLGIGGAAGSGIVYTKGMAIGSARMKQLTIGFQAGGQAYREVIFFESKNDMDRFKNSNFELSAQASAVAVTEGASANLKYKDGVMIFTQTKGGLMYEASVGGQKFDFKSF